MDKLYISLKWKLISIYLLFSIFIMVIIFFVSYKISEKNLFEMLKNDYLISIKELASKIDNNYDLYNSNIDSDISLKYMIEEYGDLLNNRILLINLEKKVICDSYYKIMGKVIKNSAFINKSFKILNYNEFSEGKHGKILFISSPVYFNNEIDGLLVFSINLNYDDINSYLNNITSSLYKSAIFVLLFILIISIIISTYYTNILHQLKNNLVNLNYYQKYEKLLPKKRYDELGDLINQINIMMVKINEVNTIRDNFVANVSHELRTPIASMLIISDSLIDNAPDNIEIYKDFMKDINAELKRLTSILNTLLQLVNLEKDDITLDYTIVNMDEFVIKNIDILKPIAGKKGINIKYSGTKSLYANIDSVKYSQAFINILNNAIKYSFENSDINVRLYIVKSNIYLEIQDFGIGIEENKLETIFDRFYRVDDARSRNTGGSGLGLSISKQIIKLHLGEIKVSSVLGKGSIFTIIIPKDALKLN